MDGNHVARLALGEDAAEAVGGFAHSEQLTDERPALAFHAAWEHIPGRNVSILTGNPTIGWYPSAPGAVSDDAKMLIHLSRFEARPRMHLGNLHRSDEASAEFIAEST